MIRLDTKDVTRFASQMRKAAPLVYKDLGQNLRAAGELVANDARRRASFSSNIPATIKVRRRAAAVAVQAGPGTFPHAGEAAAFEHQGNPGTFRHPVFGHREVWVNQQAHPFLQPAAEANVEQVAQMMENAFEQAFREAGLA